MDVDTIKDWINELNDKFDDSLVAFKDMVDKGESDEFAAYCAKIEPNLDPKACEDLVYANAEAIKCKSRGNNCTSEKKASIFATGGLRNNVRESVDLLDTIIKEVNDEGDFELTEGR
eukprot:409694_1